MKIMTEGITAVVSKARLMEEGSNIAVPVDSYCDALNLCLKEVFEAAFTDKAKYDYFSIPVIQYASEDLQKVIGVSFYVDEGDVQLRVTALFGGFSLTKKYPMKTLRILYKNKTKFNTFIKREIKWIFNGVTW